MEGQQLPLGSENWDRITYTHLAVMGKLESDTLGSIVALK